MGARATPWSGLGCPWSRCTACGPVQCHSAAPPDLVGFAPVLSLPVPAFARRVPPRFGAPWPPSRFGAP
eukprot:3042449-Alexandrium_andersonii.AAC.1